MSGLCQIMVPERPYYIRYHRCSKQARYVLADGKRVCGTHRRKAWKDTGVWAKEKIE